MPKLMKIPQQLVPYRKQKLFGGGNGNLDGERFIVLRFIYGAL